MLRYLRPISSRRVAERLLNDGAGLFDLAPLAGLAASHPSSVTSVIGHCLEVIDGIESIHRLEVKTLPQL